MYFFRNGNSAPRKVRTVAEQHEAARIWWKRKLENKTVDNEELVIRSFGCQAKCEEWVYGKISIYECSPSKATVSNATTNSNEKNGQNM